MNVLTSMLQHELQQGRIRGLILAREAPPMTNLMFADDLLIMGSATRQEAHRINKVLQTFCNLSGQRISPEISKIWFSRATPLAQMRSTMQIFGAKFSDENVTYLGGPVNVSRPRAFQELLQKMDKRLHAWKAKLLSPAGKLVLIKSVLESLPIYQMSSTMFHKAVLDKIQSECVRFSGEKLILGRFAW